MFVDKLLMFSDAQALTATAASTNSIDLQNARDLGAGQDLYVVLVIDVALTDASSNSTVDVDLEMDSSETFTPDKSQRLFRIAALAAAGTKYVAKISPDMDLRYAQLKYTMNNGDLTTGTVTAFITTDVQQYKSYPKGYTIN